MRRLTIRVDDDLANTIDKVTNNTNEYVINCIKHFLECKGKAEEIPSLRPILSKFRGKCSKPDCGKVIEVGEPCYWSKGIVICMDCIIQKGLGDKTLIAKYLKTRELNRTLKVLQNECDRLASQIENLSVSDRLEKLISQINERNNLLFKYLTEVKPLDKERETLEELKRHSEVEKEMIRDLEIFMESRLDVKVKRKEKAII